MATGDRPNLAYLMYQAEVIKYQEKYRVIPSVVIIHIEEEYWYCNVPGLV